MLGRVMHGVTLLVLLVQDPCWHHSCFSFLCCQWLPWPSDLTLKAVFPRARMHVSATGYRSPTGQGSCLLGTPALQHPVLEVAGLWGKSLCQGIELMPRQCACVYTRVHHMCTPLYAYAMHLHMSEFTHVHDAHRQACLHM